MIANGERRFLPLSLFSQLSQDLLDSVKSPKAWHMTLELLNLIYLIHKAPFKKEARIELFLRPYNAPGLHT